MPENSVQQEPQTRHTPGPVEMWREHRPVSGVEADPQNGKFHGMCIRCIREWPCEYSPESDFAREQDAIRADLLAALVDLVDGMDDDPMFDAARAAIARATGGES